VTTRKPLRAKLATSVSKGAAALSRATGRGDGSVIGGRLGLMIDPDLLAHLSSGRQIALISGTNGKTTTTRLTTAALGVLGPVATNSYGANMPTGHTSALAKAGDTPYAVLETDEHYLPQVLAATHPKVIALLNLSRDQLDRAKEVAMMAQLWRETLRGQPVHLVANADDPMVVWATGGSERVTWVAAGQRWHDDSWVCPECGGAIARAGETPPAPAAAAAAAGTAPGSMIASGHIPDGGSPGGPAGSPTPGAAGSWAPGAAGSPTPGAAGSWAPGAAGPGAPGSGGAAYAPPGMIRTNAVPDAVQADTAGAASVASGAAAASGIRSEATAPPTVETGSTAPRLTQSGPTAPNMAPGGAVPAVVAPAGAATGGQTAPGPLRSETMSASQGGEPSVEAVAEPLVDSGGGNPDADWHCTNCTLRRPTPQWTVDSDAVIDPWGARHHIKLQLPGRVNRANAATALAIAAEFGVPPAEAVPRLAEVASVAGRYAQVERDGKAIRLLLAKNPAGWLEAFDMADDAPTLLSINARDPDGLDTSWLFDVDFSPLAGRPVLITGDRAFDLAVRLEVNEVRFRHVRSFAEALAATPPGRLEVIANYTAFQDIRAELDRVN
jgi:UDP-N-acetylmuramyl tripeptide synthase